MSLREQLHLLSKPSPGWSFGRGSSDIKVDPWITDVPSAIVGMTKLSQRKLKARFRKGGKEAMPESMATSGAEKEEQLDGAYMALDDDERTVDLVWLAGRLPLHMLDVMMSEKSPADLAIAGATKGGRWVRYLVGCCHVIQALCVIGSDSPAVLFHLARGSEGRGTRLIVDALLFALAVGMASLCDVDEGGSPEDSMA
eukprot:CAMPEP_0169435568 /NCGR_PEP_ID=MMETSP1042-20121227/5131_1 /TAXON_ID=464988 /ORGANISM="Hemiselmis andersenii, Strain CCMP1180" /LENGTH=197 /DNA_ID=CAMNT_0009546217 /DNA_START=53 /DNA_END=642 /DNA_ORIENTATION=-